MKQRIVLSEGGKTSPSEPLKFSFTNQATTAPKLIDAYIGVDFSIVFKIVVVLKGKSGATSDKKGEAQYYCKVPDGGIDPQMGHKLVPLDFVISDEKLASGGGTKLPRFKFTGRIDSTNCCYDEPFQGHVLCEYSEIDIKSIEI